MSRTLTPTVPAGRRAVHALALRLLSPAEQARLGRLDLTDGGHGYDAFGMHPDWVKLYAGVLRFWHDDYFRVLSSGGEHIPPSGAAIMVANHGGLLPVDAAMLYYDVLMLTDPPRALRPVTDHFVSRLPFVGTLMARAGAIGGSYQSCHELLEAGQILQIFPEGTRGMAKLKRQRYQIQRWTLGHAELAIRHRVPIIPVGLVGPDEQWPELGRLPVRPFGAPYLPIPATPLPLPVRYHIRYGEPIDLSARYRREQADDPLALADAAAEVRAAVEQLIARELGTRVGVFS